MAEPRRRWLSRLVFALPGVLAGVTGLPLVLAPWLQRRRTKASFVPVAPAHLLSKKKPVRLVIRGDLEDGWTKAKNVQLGVVWARKDDDGRPMVLSAECPHLGCNINLSEDAKGFVCPCHESDFSMDGNVLRGPSPRAMDPLRARVRGEQLEVEFKRFRTQSKERIEV